MCSVVIYIKVYPVKLRAPKLKIIGVSKRRSAWQYDVKIKINNWKQERNASRKFLEISAQELIKLEVNLKLTYGQMDSGKRH